MIVQSLGELAVRLAAKLKEAKLTVVGAPDLLENGPEAKRLALGQTASAELVTQLSDQGITMIERAKIAAILSEQEMSMTGIIDEELAVRAGRLVGARAFLFGSVSDAGAWFSINVRAVNTETAVVVATEQVQVARSHMVALSSDAVELKSKSGAIYRSFIPGWGQFYNDQPIKGAIFVALTAGALASTLTLHFLGAAQEDKNNTRTDPAKWTTAQVLDYKQKAEDYYLWRNISAIGIGVIWAAGILDAAISAKSYVRGPDGAIHEARLVPPADSGAQVRVTGVTVPGDALGTGLGLLVSY